jgi:hypothetical protein
MFPLYFSPYFFELLNLTKYHFINDLKFLFKPKNDLISYLLQPFHGVKLFSLA